MFANPNTAASKAAAWTLGFGLASGLGRLPARPALIVVAAARSGAERILSEDLQHGRTIAGVHIENPFRR